MPLTLSTGHAVHLKPGYTHRMEVAFKEAVGQSLVLRQEGDTVVADKIQADVLDRVAEAVLPLLVERITKDGQDVLFSRDWLLDLPEEDFALLRERVLALRAESEARQGEGKKTAERVGRLLLAGAREFPPEYALFRLCRALCCLPEDVLRMEEHHYRLFLDLLNAEGEAAIMEAKRSSQPPRGRH